MRFARHRHRAWGWLDYCSEENAFLIPARIVRFREKRIAELETVDYPFLAEPDPDALKRC